MTDIDTLATEARRRAQGEIAMVEVPEAERVLGERRRRHAVRNGMAAVAIVAVLGVGVGAAVAANNGGTPKPDVAVAPVDDRAVLEFREVQNEFECDRSRPLPAGVEVVPDAKNENCYILGPALMNGSSLADVEVVYSEVSSGYELRLTFSNDDFEQLVAEPMVTKQVAVVVDGVVYSAPTINAGITGREVSVTGEFDAAEVRTLAAALRGVPESEVEVPPTTPGETIPAAIKNRFELTQGPACLIQTNQPNPASCEGTTAGADQVRAVEVRMDDLRGKVIDVTFDRSVNFNETDPAYVWVGEALVQGVPAGDGVFTLVDAELMTGDADAAAAEIRERAGLTP